MQWWCSAVGVDWTWAWRAYPGVWLFVLGVVVGARAIAGRNAWREATAGERAAIVGGVLLLWASLDWPLGPIAAGYLVSAHALQFLIETMLAAPLILYALRASFGRRVEARGARPLPGAVRALFHPLIAVVLFNVIVAVTHVPSVVDALMPSGGGAFLVDSAWFFSGIVFWWPVIMPAPRYAHFGVPMKILYLLIGTLFHTVIGMVLLSAETPIYGIYELAPPILPVPPRADQQLGGGIMEIGVFFAIVVGSGILFFRWAARDEQRAR
ncbi:MAG TPA: cytochrome c oxidase assembly protein [Gemmatimonadaceae bacterium]|nr:cytochrome c oxidase assembly protein [Gemmatimonadaceae bacterium]